MPASAGPAAGQGKPEDQVVVYSAADADMVNAMVAAFQAKYPAIKASTVVAGTGEIIKRVEAEAGRPLGDVVWSVGPESLGAKKNLFATYESREAAAFFPGQTPSDREWTPFTVMPYIIMYNKKLVPEAEAPKSWKDVLDARWKGKVAYADATKSGSSYTLLVTWLTVFGKNDTGWKYVEDVLRQSKVLPKSSMTYQMVANAEIPLGLTFEQAAFEYLKGGAPSASCTRPRAPPSSRTVAPSSPTRPTRMRHASSSTSRSRRRGRRWSSTSSVAGPCAATCRRRRACRRSTRSSRSPTTSSTRRTTGPRS